MSHQNPDYVLGLDIGMGSVGWAVAEEDYRIPSFGGHKMWGTRLLGQGGRKPWPKEGEDRRRARCQARLDTLRLLFQEEMAKLDPHFFLRLDESPYGPDWGEPEPGGASILFADAARADRDFFATYPTIFHLRAALIAGEEDAFDLRSLYLAFHHILQDRGHYLWQEGFGLRDDPDLRKTLQEVLAFKDVLDHPPRLDLDALAKILGDRGKTPSEKKRALREIPEIKTHRQVREILVLATGSPRKLSALFATDDPAFEEVTVDFQKGGYEDQWDDYEALLGESIFFLDTLKKLHDQVKLLGIKHRGMSLSESKVADYDKHQKDLSFLKNFVHKHYSKETVHSIFYSPDLPANYPAYRGQGPRCDQKAFYSFLKSKKGLNLKKKKGHKEVDRILDQMKKETFLPWQKSPGNQVLPYQVHLTELEIILQKARAYFPFLQEKREGEDRTPADTILDLMASQTPYRPEGSRSQKAPCGPGCLHHTCPYVSGEKVLPKHSLIYSQALVFHELNQLRIGDDFLTPAMKACLVDHLKTEEGPLTEEIILQLLAQAGLSSKGDKITGIGQGLEGDFKAYRDFTAILGEDFDRALAEDLVRWITLFADDWPALSQKIHTAYPGRVREDQIAQIKDLRYRGWGHWSRKLLTQVTDPYFANPATGHPGTLLEALASHPFTLTDFLGHRFAFGQALDDLNEEAHQKKTPSPCDLIADLRLSPVLKDSLRQAHQVLEEIIRIRGGPPTKIFVDLARINRVPKKATQSRKQRLIALYKKITDDSRDWVGEIEAWSDANIQSKRLYLYYLQQGLDLYSGDPISLQDLMARDQDLYDIDHIYPQSRVKDDTFDNLALVARQANMKKGDTFPLDPAIQKACKKLWSRLRKQGFISKRKYTRLTRTSGFSSKELANFILRQLVATSPATKAVTGLLKLLYPDAEIITSKAENVSSFRKDKDLVKVKGLNHHCPAKDTYLSIVVGIVYQERFTSNPLAYIKDLRKKHGDTLSQAYSLRRIFDSKIEKEGRTLWDPDTSMDTVRKMMASDDVRVTRRVQDGTPAYALIRASIAPIGKPQERKPQRELFPISPGDPPGLHQDSQSILDLYRAHKKAQGLEATDTTILLSSLPHDSLIRVNHFPFLVKEHTGDRLCLQSAAEITLDEGQRVTLKKVIKEVTHLQGDKTHIVENRPDRITPEDNLALYKALAHIMARPHFHTLTDKGQEFLTQETIDRFQALSLNHQVESLTDMLNILNNHKPTSPHMGKYLGIEVARKTLPLVLDPKVSVTVVKSSVTGLFEEEVVISGEG